jgi:hypothetical protein
MFDDFYHDDSVSASQREFLLKHTKPNSYLWFWARDGRVTGTKVALLMSIFEEYFNKRALFRTPAPRSKELHLYMKESSFKYDNAADEFLDELTLAEKPKLCGKLMDLFFPGMLSTMFFLVFLLVVSVEHLTCMVLQEPYVQRKRWSGEL